MANALALIKLLLALGPDIIAFIQKLEGIFPESGKGAEKLALLKEYLAAIWDTAGSAIPVFETVWPKIASVVGAIVGLFNKTGIFKK